MRRYGIALVLVFLTVALAAPGVLHAQGYSLNDLIERAAEVDGQVVTIRGEAVGDIMVRGERGWVNINDGTAAIGIWAPAEQLRQIRHTGRYGVRGDTVEVTGTFFRMDPMHGGELDVQADALVVATPGAAHPASLKTGRVVWALVFALTATLAVILLRRRRWEAM